MAVSYNTKRKIRNACIAVLCCVAVGCTCLASACSEDTVTYPKGTDTQNVKNGTFEYFTIPDDAVYLIKNPDDWALDGDSSAAMSGIISTSDQGWSDLTDPDLAAALDYNNDLDSDDDDYADKYVDYNGMKSSDILYKDTYAATLDIDDLDDSYIASFNGEANDERSGYEAYFDITRGSGNTGTMADGTTVYYNEADGDYYFDSAFTKSVRLQQIDNPGTHYDIKKDSTGQYIEVDGEKQYLYENDTTGDLFYINEEDYAKEAAAGTIDANDVSEDFRTYISNILMIHNAESTDNGIQQYYSSSTTITLSANTAAEISVWVKTSDLKFDKGYNQNNDQDRGAYIEVALTINGSTVDPFRISAINTEKILNQYTTLPNSNGWIQYTIYVSACDFADTTVSVNLGLGSEDQTEKVSGYAFFDDLEITQYVGLDSEGCTYGDHTADLTSSTCNLTSDEDDRIFYADYSYTEKDDRNAQDRYYFIDLASESVNTDTHYEGIKFDENNVTAGLTTQDVSDKTYVSSKDDDARYTGVAQTDTSDAILPKTMTDSRKTSSDLVGVYDLTKKFDASDFAGNNYSARLNTAVENLASLPKANTETTNMLVLLSAYGAAYTATISDSSFTLASDEYVIVSFWVKTSDMNGQTAATFKIYDTSDEDSSQSFTFETTDVTTDVGDEEDIYDGWVQCFFFVHNDSEDERTFNIDFSFGNTTLNATTNNSYYYGWAIAANMQILESDEDINGIASSGSYSASFEMTDETDDTTGTSFDTADDRSDITTGIANTSSYSGVNGTSSTVNSDAAYSKELDAYDTNSAAGLINKDYFEDYDTDLQEKILTSFADASANWESVFGDLTYQPLIIINNLRTYAELQTATAETYGNYYVLCEEDYDGAVVGYNGKTYRKVDTDTDVFDEDTEYYSLTSVCNYGYVGASSTFSSSGYTTISVKVMVSGDATAYIYLIDPTTNDILGYETPEYTFWYDDDGNVLDAEYDSSWTDKQHRTHIIYSMRDDGLYENYQDPTDEKLYANVYNLNNVYTNMDFEHSDFYYLEDDGSYSYISFDDLEENEDYYYLTSSGEYILADHYLSASDGSRVYEYDAEAQVSGSDTFYYYLIDEEYTYTDPDDEDEEITAYRQIRDTDDDGNLIKVYGFDTQYTRDYSQITQDATPYFVTVGNTNGQWVTVNFVIATGNLSKKYRIELWSGDRNSTGVADDGSISEGAIAFDYSAFTVTDDDYTDLLSEYEQNIIRQYNELLSGADISLVAALPSATENIAFYKKYVAALIDGDTATLCDMLDIDNDEAETLIADAASITVDTVEESNDYQALYYTYSFFDSSSYVPWNAETAADGETGYDYNASDYVESLAFFTYNVHDEETGMITEYNIIADYSVVDKEVTIGTVTINEEEEEETETTYEVWLLVTSIILTVVLIFTLIALLVREIVKRVGRHRSKKAKEKNMYRKRERYIRRLHLATNEDTPAPGENK